MIPPLPSQVSANAEPPRLLTEKVGSQPASDAVDAPLKEAFSDFVGQTFFGELIKSMRTTQKPAAYFDGGRAEEIFRGQFDQVLAEELSDASGEQIADPMYELFMLKRQQ